MAEDYEKTSQKIKAIRRFARPVNAKALPPKVRPRRDLSFLNKLSGVKGPQPAVKKLNVLGSFKPRIPDPVHLETAESIASRLNSLRDVLEPHVIHGFITVEAVIEAIRGLKGDARLDISNIKNGEFLSIAAQRKGISMDDMRWHGGGLSNVIHDDTLTGEGTTESPLSVVSSGGGLTELTTSGEVNSMNLVFDFVDPGTMLPAIPSYVVADGLWLKPLDNNGNVQWSNVGATVTMVNPPSFSIFGFLS